METSLHFATSCTRTLQGSIREIGEGRVYFTMTLQGMLSGEGEEVP